MDSHSRGDYDQFTQVKRNTVQQLSNPFWFECMVQYAVY